MKQLAWHVISETVKLMHAFVQNRHNADRAIRQYAPINIMMLVAAVETLDAKIFGDSPPSNLARSNFLEPCEEPANVALGLGVSPRRSCINIDVVDPPTGSFLHTIGGHICQARAFRAITASASSDW